MARTDANPPNIVTGSGAPTTAPERVGDIYIDLLSQQSYSAVSIVDETGWKLTTSISGGRLDNWTAITDPTVTDDANAGYEVGSVWLNTSTAEAYRCVDASIGAAIWIITTLSNDDLATVAFTGAYADLSGVPAFLLNLVEDLSPQLGANLDMNGHDIDFGAVTGYIQTSGVGGKIRLYAPWAGEGGGADIHFDGNVAFNYWVSSSIVPSYDAGYSLGGSGNGWYEIYLGSGGALYIDNQYAMWSPAAGAMAFMAGQNAILRSDTNNSLTLKAGSAFGEIKINGGANGNIEINPNGTGKIILGNAAQPIEIQTVSSQDLIFNVAGGEFRVESTLNYGLIIKRTSAGSGAYVKTYSNPTTPVAGYIGGMDIYYDTTTFTDIAYGYINLKSTNVGDSTYSAEFVVEMAHNGSIGGQFKVTSAGALVATHPDAVDGIYLIPYSTQAFDLINGDGYGLAAGANGLLTRIHQTNGSEEIEVVPKKTSVATGTTITPTGNAGRNEHYVTALASALTINAPSGTPANGNQLTIRLKDNGTVRALTLDAIYRAVGVTLPTTTTANKTMYIGCRYNSTDSKWDVIAVVEEA